MSEIRCPMCGKPNPEHLEECQFCGARLKPLRLSSPQEIENSNDIDPGSTEANDDEDSWLSHFRADADQDGNNDWLTEDDPPEDEDEPAQADDPDWLQRIRSLHGNDQTEVSDLPQEDETQIELASHSIDSNGDDETVALPDQEEASYEWLSSDEHIAENKEIERDWISELSGANADSEFMNETPEDDTPDWLSDLGIMDLTTPETDLPEQSLIFDPKDEETGEAADSEREDEDNSKRLQDVLGEPEFDPTDYPKQSLEEDIALTEEEDLTSWFSELDEGLKPESGDATSKSDDEMPSWQKSLGSVATGSVEDTSTQDETEPETAPFVREDEFDEDLLDIDRLPEWLSPESGELDDEIEEEDLGLVKSELPGWLEAIRPADDQRSASELDDGPIESAGPLAGLRAILPAEPEIIHYKKPPVYSAKLKVNESQLTQADILKGLIAIEGKTTPLPEPPQLLSQRAFRWFTAIILCVAVGFVVIRGSQSLPLPDLNTIPDSTYDASQIINALPEQAPVLIAFDYEPGSAGEMQAASAAIVDDLMMKAARLTLVSTLPTGPATAEYFFQNVQDQHNDNSSVQYINLGYIPGGATGLLGFTQSPQWTFPVSFEGLYPWETPPLDGINSLSDFNLFIIITDDSDTARAWIEQVQPRIEGTPLITILSAKAEPLIRPYYSQDSKSQVDGMLSGILGGAAYEAVVGRTNLGRIYWDAFSIGLIITVGLIAIGGGANCTRSLLKQNKAGKQGDGK